MTAITRALLSVTDKTGLIPFATKLYNARVELVSTGGTAKAIKEADIPCTLVEEVTGFPEMLNGRLKTIHPKIFGGVIADQADPSHMATILEYNIRPFQLVVVNLYDFAGHPLIEQIDIGGPALLRAAAKNYTSVAVVVDPINYEDIARQIEETGIVDEYDRLMLATKAFESTAHYDRMIALHFRKCVESHVHVAIGIKH